MLELYSHLHEELELRLAEAKRVGFGFDLPKAVVAPNAPKPVLQKRRSKLQRKLQKREKWLVDVAELEPAAPCLQSVNQLDTTDCYGLLSCLVFLAFRCPDLAGNAYLLRWFVI